MEKNFCMDDVLKAMNFVEQDEEDYEEDYEEEMNHNKQIKSDSSESSEEDEDDEESEQKQAQEESSSSSSSDDDPKEEDPEKILANSVNKKVARQQKSVEHEKSMQKYTKKIAQQTEDLLDYNDLEDDFEYHHDLEDDDDEEEEEDFNEEQYFQTASGLSLG